MFRKTCLGLGHLTFPSLEWTHLLTCSCCGLLGCPDLHVGCLSPATFCSHVPAPRASFAPAKFFRRRCCPGPGCTCSVQNYPGARLGALCPPALSLLCRSYDSSPGHLSLSYHPGVSHSLDSLDSLGLCLSLPCSSPELWRSRLTDLWKESMRERQSLAGC